MLIDTTFDFRRDSNGRDPDSHSATLRKYHRILWSKELPIGEFLELEESGSSLVYRFNMQTIKFGSDSISNSYINTKRISHLLDLVERSEFEDFRDKGCTIGGFIIFPSSRSEGKMTINGARGFNHKIADRFDLTLECIRLHYEKQPNPLEGTLNTHTNKFFFSLFKNFQGYIEFFLLQDLFDYSTGQIKFFTEVKLPFTTSPIPQTEPEYMQYKKSTVDFVERRNHRINDWVKITHG